MRGLTTDNDARKRRSEFLLKMAILKEKAGDTAAAEHFLEQAIKDQV